MSERPSAPPSAAVTAFRLAALSTMLAVAMGSVVCATRSGAACPTWPGCRPEAIAPRWQLNPVLEFGHRAVAITAGPLILASAVTSLRLPGTGWRVRLLPWVALACAIASGAFGRLVVLRSIPTWLGAVDLACALAAMTLTAISAVSVGTAQVLRARPEPVAPRLARPAVAALVTLVALHVTGVFAAGTGSYTRCLGWPLWRLVDVDPHPALQVVRLVLAAAAAALTVRVALVAARSERCRPLGAALAGLLGGEAALGLVLAARGLHDGLASAYSVIAVVLLWCLALLAGLAGPDPAAVPRGPGRRTLQEADAAAE
ncbi:MAG TPA: hypothetical protein VI248_05095 [Kineosporiaceae bacterium]